MIPWVGEAEVSSGHGTLCTISRQKSLCFHEVVEISKMYPLNLLLSIPKIEL